MPRLLMTCCLAAASALASTGAAPAACRLESQIAALGEPPAVVGIQSLACPIARSNNTLGASGRAPVS